MKKPMKRKPSKRAESKAPAARIPVRFVSASVEAGMVQGGVSVWVDFNHVFILNSTFNRLIRWYRRTQKLKR